MPLPYWARYGGLWPSGQYGMSSFSSTCRAVHGTSGLCWARYGGLWPNGQEVTRGTRVTDLLKLVGYPVGAPCSTFLPGT